jgi:hypothetical protein
MIDHRENHGILGTGDRCLGSEAGKDSENKSSSFRDIEIDTER